MVFLQKIFSWEISQWQDCVPDEMKAKCMEYTTDDMHEVMAEFGC